jgi:hypothetical protein
MLTFTAFNRLELVFFYQTVVSSTVVFRCLQPPSNAPNEFGA